MDRPASINPHPKSVSLKPQSNNTLKNLIRATLLGMTIGWVVLGLEYKRASQRPYIFVRDVVPSESSFDPKYSEWKIDKIVDVEGPQKMITLKYNISWPRLLSTPAIVGLTGAVLYFVFLERGKANLRKPL